MTVAFSESDISKIKVGQPATVTLDALAGVQLAAHVSQISPVGSTSSSVVSYDATLTLDQNDSQVKPGMSASASVITGQASGRHTPQLGGDRHRLARHRQRAQERQDGPTQVVVGLRGDSRTQIISGLAAGEQVVVTITLPSLSSTATTGSAPGRSAGRALRWRRRARRRRRVRRAVAADSSGARPEAADGPPAKLDERPAVMRAQRFLRAKREQATQREAAQREARKAVSRPRPPASRPASR